MCIQILVNKVGFQRKQQSVLITACMYMCCVQLHVNTLVKTVAPVRHLTDASACRVTEADSAKRVNA